MPRRVAASPVAYVERGDRFEAGVSPFVPASVALIVSSTMAEHDVTNISCDDVFQGNSNRSYVTVGPGAPPSGPSR